MSGQDWGYAKSNGMDKENSQDIAENMFSDSEGSNDSYELSEEESCANDQCKTDDECCSEESELNIQPKSDDTDEEEDDPDGPKYWPSIFPEARGKNQSPVDIQTKERYLKTPAEIEMGLTWNYEPDICLDLCNTGYCWKVHCRDEGSELRGGPLDGTYRLEQFHCHWGKDNSEGSEHTVDGHAYAGELHLVHRNITKYESAEEAAMHPDGFCVLGIFLQPGNNNEELEKLTSIMEDIKHKGQTVEIQEDFDITKVIPEKSGYYNYYGSLTTPPCSECVIWVVFQKPIEISNDQLETFRQLKCVGEGEDCECSFIHENFRPTNPIGERTIVKYSE